MSTTHELEHSGMDFRDSAVARCRDVLAAFLGPPRGRSFDVRFWDGVTDRGNSQNPRFTLVLNRPASLRRMLMPPSELSLVESYISGDIDIEGSMEAGAILQPLIRGRLDSAAAVANLVNLVLKLPGKADDDLADARFPEHARKLGPR